MRHSLLHGSWLRKVCKTALAATVLGLAFVPGESQARCPRICPQFVTQFCVVEPDGAISTVLTNGCFACWAHQRILYQGACKMGPPWVRTCNKTGCS